MSHQIDKLKICFKNQKDSYLNDIIIINLFLMKVLNFNFTYYHDSKLKREILFFQIFNFLIVIMNLFRMKFLNLILNFNLTYYYDSKLKKEIKFFHIFNFLNFYFFY